RHIHGICAFLDRQRRFLLRSLSNATTNPPYTEKMVCMDRVWISPHYTSVMVSFGSFHTYNGIDIVHQSILSWRCFWDITQLISTLFSTNPKYRAAGQTAQI